MPNLSWRDYKAEIEAKLKAEPMIVYGVIKSAAKADANEEGWMMGLCPFHRDTTPSFAFNVNHLGWVCFAGCGKGDVWDFLLHRDGRGFREALVTMGDDLKIARPSGAEWVNRPPIDSHVVEQFTEQLLNHEDPDVLKYLREKRGLTDETIRARQIGWSKKHERYTIPIFDARGICWNVRLYKPNVARAKMKHFYTSHHTYGSPPRLYGVDLLKDEKDSLVALCEGEWDAILVTQAGVTAVSSTHGCDVFEDEWFKALKGRDVAICYDCDDKGKRAVTDNLLPRFAKHIKDGTIKSVKIIALPLAGSKSDKDVTDWFVKRGCDSSQFKKLIYDTPVHEFSDEVIPQQQQFEELRKIASEPPIRLNSFLEIDRSDLIGKRVVCDITVCGETSESFFATEQFEVLSCPDKIAGRCSLCKDPITVPHGARDFIGSCMSTDAQVIAMLGRNYCPRGQRPHLRITTRRTVREFFCHQRVNRISNASATTVKRTDEEIRKLMSEPQDATKKKPAPAADERLIAPGRRNEELVERKVYYLSDETVKPGHYCAEGWVVSRPQSQHSSFLIETLIAQDDDYEAFVVADHLSELREFRKLTVEQIIDDICENVTRVYKRDEMLLGILLTYLSPRWFVFNGELLRGWICMGIIGDVGTAKTKTYTNLANWIDVGDVFSSLTGSRTGLAYAFHKSQKGWNARLGRYPANSRKLLMVDEVQMLRHADLKSITKAMDEGVMLIDRVESKSYESQTRAVFIGNPRSAQMDDYMLGCQALKPVFPAMMIRRLDFAIIANQRDVKDVGDLLNAMHHSAESHTLLPEQLRAAIYTMWNMQPDAIEIPTESRAECVTQAKILSEKYGYATDVPLVTQYEIDKKIARLSVALAALDGSFNDDFTRLTVRPEHVTMLANFLDNIYQDENFQLDTYSGYKKQVDGIDDYDKLVAKFDEIIEKERHSTHGKPNSFKRMLFRIWSSNLRRDGDKDGEATISRNDIAESTGLSPQYVSRKIKVLVESSLITSGRSGYIKTPKFSRFMNLLLKTRPEYFGAVNQVTDDDDAPEDSGDRSDGQLELDMQA